MHKQVVNVIIAGLHVLLRCEANKTIFKKEYSQRIDSIEEHIKAHVKLQTVNQIGISDILLSDTVVFWIHVTRVLHQIYTLTLT